MRGKVPESPSDALTAGITPAYAGKSAHRVRRSDSRRDHPRVCGEKLLYLPARQGLKGSPPRMRGKADAATPAGAVLRITPAYAGKRQCSRPPAGGHQDHPRVCGEKCLQVPYLHRLLGSPPRMRGKVPCRIGSLFVQRITPAYAGKSLRFLSSAHHIWDHPRVCGEKGSAAAAESGLGGSPPRMRGKALAPAPTIDIIGITPAYAGKRYRTGNEIMTQRDHPRVCGEKR